jgi:hypothetical protein
MVIKYLDFVLLNECRCSKVILGRGIDKQCQPMLVCRQD